MMLSHQYRYQRSTVHATQRIQLLQACYSCRPIARVALHVSSMILEGRWCCWCVCARRDNVDQNTVICRCGLGTRAVHKS